jgi:hypothetical protein
MAERGQIADQTRHVGDLDAEASAAFADIGQRLSGGIYLGKVRTPDGTVHSASSRSFPEMRGSLPHYG